MERPAVVIAQALAIPAVVAAPLGRPLAAALRAAIFAVALGLDVKAQPGIAPGSGCRRAPQPGGKRDCEDERFHVAQL